MKEGREFKKLGDIATFVNGYAFKPSQWSEKGMPIIRIQNLNTPNANFNYFEGKIPQKYHVKKGDILISWSASLGAYEWEGNDAYLNQHIFKVVFDKIEVDKHYLRYAVISKLSDMEKDAHGATMRHIVKKDFDNTKIPFPSPTVQQRIVSELDLLSSIIEKKKAQLKEYDQLAQSIFYDMFGDPITNEKGWEVKKLEEVCRAIGDGLHGTPQYDANGTIAFINGNNLIDGKITITPKTLYVNNSEAQKIHIELDTNTILLSINGTLGKTAVYNNEKVVLGKSACYCKLTNKLNVDFVLSLMNTNTFKCFLESNSSKSTIKNVGLKAIRNYKVILPPLPLQQKFASKIEAIERQKTLIQQSIDEVQTLFDSRMDYWFG